MSLVLKALILSVTPSSPYFVIFYSVNTQPSKNDVAPVDFEVNKYNEVCKVEVSNDKPRENRLQPCSQPFSAPARCVQLHL